MKLFALALVTAFAVTTVAQEGTTAQTTTQPGVAPTAQTETAPVANDLGGKVVAKKGKKKKGGKRKSGHHAHHGSH